MFPMFFFYGFLGFSDVFWGLVMLVGACLR